ncbi:hypothetical protein V8B97DRAFT_1933538 [Scleroderma yunnanense]
MDSSGYSQLFTWGLLQERGAPEPSEYFFTLQPRSSLDLRSFLSFDQHTKRSRSTSWTFCTHDKEPRRERCASLASTPVSPSVAQPTSLRTGPLRESTRTIPSPKPAPSTTLPAPPVQSTSLSSPSKARTAPPSPRHTRSSSSFLVSSSHKKQSLSASNLSIVSPLSPTKPLSYYHRASPSAPQSGMDSSLLSPRFPRSPLSAQAHARTRSMSSAARSDSITSSAKRRSRMDALACLEGRGRKNHRRSITNFMSWSDDEDSEACVPKETPRTIKICIEDMGMLGDVEDGDDDDSDHDDDGDVVVVAPSGTASQPVPIIGSVPISQSSQLGVHRKGSWKRPSVSPARSAPLSTSLARSAMALSPSAASAPTLHARSISGGLAPLAVARPQPISASAPTSRQRKRRSTINSWFALRSFIDLRADTDERATAARSSTGSPPWNWRSFIEIGA